MQPKTQDRAEAKYRRRFADCQPQKIISDEYLRHREEQEVQNARPARAIEGKALGQLQGKTTVLVDVASILRAFH
jgi:hypothetical protein